MHRSHDTWAYGNLGCNLSFMQMRALKEIAEYLERLFKAIAKLKW